MILKIIAIWLAVVLQFVLFNLFPIGISGLNIILIVSLVLLYSDKTKWAIITIVLGTVLIDYVSGYGYGIWPIVMFLSLGLAYYIKKFIPKKTDFFFSLLLVGTIIVFNVLFMIYAEIINHFNFSSWWFLQLLYSLILNSIIGYAIYKIYNKYFSRRLEFSF